MKILHIIGNLKAGGAEAVLVSLVLADTANEHVVVSLTEKGSFRQHLLDAGIKLIELDMRTVFLPVQGLIELYKSVRSEKPDVVQTWMYHSDLVGAFVARLAGSKNICWGIHNSNLSKAVMPLRTRMIVKLCSATSSWLPSKIISCSNYSANIHQGIGYAKDKVTVVFNGYDTQRFKLVVGASDSVRSELNLSKQCFLLGMIARWHPVKDHANLFNALSKIDIENENDWCLVLVGGGMSSNNVELTELIARHGLSKRCLLLGERNDIPRLLNALDMHILSSAGEAFPNSIAEAMACGVPCVSTNVGDAAFIVDGSGKIVPPEDSESLGAAIQSMMLELIESTEDAKSAQRHSLHNKIADRFSSDTMVEGYNSVWRAIASPQGVTRS